MKTTQELEKTIKQKIYEKIPNINLQIINFAEGSDSSPEGIYVFAENAEYIYMFTEKGSTREKIVLTDETELLWNILNSVLFEKAMEHATSSRQNGKDFRRALFSKEIELFSLFGEDFKKRKTEDIEKILLKNPYND